MLVKIKIFSTFGFCTWSQIQRLNGKVVWTSNDYPYNFRAQAYEAAENECFDRGYKIMDK